MRGRKKEPGAVRNGRDPATELTRAVVVPAQQAPVVKPRHIARSPELSETWDELIGDGSAFEIQDTPLLESWVFWATTQRQLEAQMLNAKDRSTIETCVEVVDKDGNPAGFKTSPLFQQHKQATDMNLKLSEHFGASPLARARLGLTRAATASIGEDIRLKVLKALEEHERRGD